MAPRSAGAPRTPWPPPAPRSPRSARARRSPRAPLLLALAALAPPAAALAQSGRSWRPGERVLVTRFAEVSAVAADLRTVYAASPLGLERYDLVGERWRAPVTVLDGYPAGERPLALAADPAGGTLWLATGSGLFQYETTFGDWHRQPLTVPGAVTALVPTNDGLWVLAGGSWLRVPPGSSFPEPVPPFQVPAAVRAQSGSSLERAARADPFLRSSLGSLGMGARLQHWTVTAAAPGDRPGSWWLGTWGGGLLRFDGHTGDTQRLEFGLQSIGVSALAADGRDVWFGGDGRAPVAGVTRAARDLGTWRSWDAHGDGAPATVRAILPGADAVWFAAADGLYRLDPRDARFSRLDERDGLPSSDVRALAPGAGGGLWVGTRAGLALLDAGGKFQARLLAGRIVQHLALAADTLWIASDAGFLVLPGGAPGADADLKPAPGTEGVPALAGRVLDGGPAAGTLWALTEDAVWRRDPAAGWAPVRDGTLRSIGRPLALAPDSGGVWVAGATGIAHYVAATNAWRSYTVGPDLPAGPVPAVLPLGDVVWAATPAGAVRLPLRF